MTRGPLLLLSFSALLAAGCPGSVPGYGWYDRAGPVTDAEEPQFDTTVTLADAGLESSPISADAGPPPDATGDDSGAPDQLAPDTTIVVTDAQFGEACGPGVAICAAGLQCLQISSGSPNGYCTALCSSPGQLCSGAPPGTLAACVAQLDSGYACAFLCRVGSDTYVCPAELTCSVQPNPPGSSQYPCL